MPVNAEAPTALSQDLPLIQVSAQQERDGKTVLTAKRLEQEQAAYLQDIFRTQAEISVSGGVPAAQKLYVRGVAEQLLRVTIDGAPQPQAAFHHMGGTMIEPELIKQVEVEAGTGAASAGPGALAGVVRFTTKSAADLLAPGSQLGALIKANYQSNAQAKKPSLTVFGRLNAQVDFLASMHSLRSGEYQAGNGDVVKNSIVQQDSQLVKFGLSPDAYQRAELSYQKIEDEGLRNRRPNLNLAPFNPAERQRTSRGATTLSYDYATDNPWFKWHVNAYQNNNDLQMALTTPEQAQFGTQSRGLNVRNTSQFAQHQLQLGLDYQTDTGYAQQAKLNPKDETAKVLGVYLQDALVLHDQWLLNLGVRHDHYDYTDGSGKQFQSQGWSPSASLTFMPHPQWSLKLSHASALRGVGLMEAFMRQYYDNAKVIEPEKAKNTEFMLQWQSGAWQLNASAYQQVIQNYIGLDDDRANLGEVTNHGFNANTSYQNGAWRASVGVAMSKPSLNGVVLGDANSFELGTSIGRTWNTQWQYTFAQPHITLGWNARLVEQLERVPAGARNKAGYAVHDLMAQWLPTGKESFSLSLTLKNALNRYYFEQSSFGYHPRWGSIAGLPEAGRDLRLSLAWKL